MWDGEPFASGGLIAGDFVDVTRFGDSRRYYVNTAYAPPVITTAARHPTCLEDLRGKFVAGDMPWWEFEDRVAAMLADGTADQWVVGSRPTDPTKPEYR